MYVHLENIQQSTNFLFNMFDVNAVGLAYILEIVSSKVIWPYTSPALVAYILLEFTNLCTDSLVRPILGFPCFPYTLQQSISTFWRRKGKTKAASATHICTAESHQITFTTKFCIHSFLRLMFAINIGTARFPCRLHDCKGMIESEIMHPVSDLLEFQCGPATYRLPDFCKCYVHGHTWWESWRLVHIRSTDRRILHYLVDSAKNRVKSRRISVD